MSWSVQQEGALRDVGAWLRRRDRQCFVLAGYAGTGKTTLAKHLGGDCGGKVYYAAYTGKAAHVMRQKGIAGATTIHRLIYQPKDKCDERLVALKAERERALSKAPRDEDEVKRLEKAVRDEVRNLDRPDFYLNYDSPLLTADLLVIDEYSMVDRKMGSDLLSFGCPVLALGDPGQLPPVQGDCFFDGKPDVLLTEVHRQARDNPVLWMATRAREGLPIDPGTYGESRVLKRGSGWDGEVSAEMLDADQVLVGLNITRRECNDRFRSWSGRVRSTPVLGDKLVCLRNNYEDGVLNGQTFHVEHVRVNPGGRYLELALRGDEGDVVRVLAHKKYFDRGPVEFDAWERRQANEFDYGYALTVHKSQGSEWEKVVLVDEWRGQGRRQWLYTAITRASKAITVFQ